MKQVKVIISVQAQQDVLLKSGPKLLTFPAAGAVQHASHHAWCVPTCLNHAAQMHKRQL